MVRKKKAKAVPVDLTGTTRLDFTLNKTDVIEFYCAHEEELLEDKISQVAQQLAVKLKKAEDAYDAFLGKLGKDGKYEGLQVIKDLALKKSKKKVDATVQAYKLIHKGYQALYESTKNPLMKHSGEISICAGFNLCGKTWRYEQSHISLWEHRDHKVRVTEAEKIFPSYKRTLGKNVPISKLHGLKPCYEFWLSYGDGSSNLIKSVPCGVRVDMRCQGRNKLIAHFDTRVSIPISLKRKVQTYLDILKECDPLKKELYELLIQHDELPQMKKQIKKAVVGRVLQNTQEGQLMLKALKSLRKAGTRLLTDTVK